MIFSRTFSQCRPVLAETATASSAGMQMASVDLGRDLLGACVRQVELVQHGDDRELGLFGEHRVDDRLGLDTLAAIDEQHGAFAGLQTLEHLVVEVDVSRRVDQVEEVCVAVGGVVVHRHRARLDGDTPFALEVHVVEQLRLHLALLDGARQLEQAVGQRRLSVVDVCDDAEVADEADVGHVRSRIVVVTPRPAAAPNCARLARDG